MGPSVEMFLESMTNRKPDDDQVARIEIVREMYKELVKVIFDEIPSSRERSIALTELETSLMWAVKAIILN